MDPTATPAIPKETPPQPLMSKCELFRVEQAQNRPTGMEDEILPHPCRYSKKRGFSPGYILMITYDWKCARSAYLWTYSSRIPCLAIAISTDCYTLLCEKRPDQSQIS